MRLISTHVKMIMEECKLRARDAGLRFDDETLEYIVTNRDMLEMMPKNLIPTLYDYWVHDVGVFQQKAKYKLFPSNPYETVIDSRPAMSFYNDNNPDWLNVMIFYHVLGHIDFFQNNYAYQTNRDEDFVGKALSDKRYIAQMRLEKGREVDYVIEFARGLDNLLGHHQALDETNSPPGILPEDRTRFYFGEFLQNTKKVPHNDYLKEIDRYNEMMRREGLDKRIKENLFFAEVKTKHPEFNSLFDKKKDKKPRHKDLLDYILLNSKKLQLEENEWMRSVINIVRDTGMYFAPHRRTKIMNEGWASYWHEKLFEMDDRVKGHEVDFAKINSGVVSIPRAGLNPYAIGMRLFKYIEEIGDRGRDCREYHRLKDTHDRKVFDTGAGKGDRLIFDVRATMTDFLFVSRYLDQEFVDRHSLFVLGERIDTQRMVKQYYVKSRRAEDYRQMIIDSLDHPPVIDINHEKTKNILYLQHRYEGKNLLRDYIPAVIRGLEFLWGAPIIFETTERIGDGDGNEYTQQVRYHIKDKKVSKKVLDEKDIP
ncbi:MAG: SpoVR family protein [Candidatus Woesearchaeota archaeon]